MYEYLFIFIVCEFSGYFQLFAAFWFVEPASAALIWQIIKCLQLQLDTLLPVTTLNAAHMPCFGDIDRRDVCLRSNTMGLNGTWFVVLKAPNKIHLKDSTAISLPRNHDPLTQDNQETN